MHRLILLSIVSLAACHDLILSAPARHALVAEASLWFPDREALIPTRDPFAGPPNPYGFENYETLRCSFVEPDCAAPEGGGTPKFECQFVQDGRNYTLKVKYDQRYNPLHPLWALGEQNNEVYASPVVERLLWMLGFGADIAVPMTIRCLGCPLEPWTYVRASCGLHDTDWISRWIDLELYLSGQWRTKVDVLELNASLAYIDWDLYQPADRIFAAANDTGDPPSAGWGWYELENMANPHNQSAERDALTIFAALVSHADNIASNQGFNCIKNDSVLGAANDTCIGVPFLFLHDVGCTLGFGWDIWTGDLWPDALDLEQWLPLSIWSDLATCTVQVHGLEDASWKTTWQVSEAGRAMLARLLSAVTPAQVEALFNVARVDLFKSQVRVALQTVMRITHSLQSIPDWVAGWRYKVERDILNVTCSS